MFPPHVGQADFRLDTFQDLVDYFTRCIKGNIRPAPREIVFILIPWAKKGPILRPDLRECSAAASPQQQLVTPAKAGIQCRYLAGRGNRLDHLIRTAAFQCCPLLRQPRLCYTLRTPLNDVGNPRACCLVGRG